MKTPIKLRQNRNPEMAGFHFHSGQNRPAAAARAWLLVVSLMMPAAAAMAGTETAMVTRPPVAGIVSNPPPAVLVDVAGVDRDRILTLAGAALVLPPVTITSHHA